MPPLLRRLTGPRDPAFAAVPALYAAAFPASERKPATYLAEALERADYRLYVLIEGERPIGFAAVFLAPAEEVALLEYMAIAEDRRGRGCGSRLFDEVALDLGRPLLVEVETDRHPGPGRSARRRRKHFYRRRGCRQIGGLDYAMPKVAAADPPAMDLMICGIAGPELEKARVARWLGEIYRHVYGRRRDDPAIARMLAELPERVELI